MGRRAKIQLEMKEENDGLVQIYLFCEYIKYFKLALWD